MSFPRYPSYKDSGVAWLGEVPEHWEVKRLKQNARLLTEKTDRRDHPVALENIESWTGRFISTETEFQGEGIAFDANDILFGKLRPYLAKAYRAEFSGEAVGDFHVMRPATGIDSRFAQYQILNREFIAIVDGSTFGSKMPRASWEFVGGMKVTTPPLTEQTQIAAFLDRETAKIDGLVAEQRRLMELLKEKRQAVISHAVTQGLNPHAPMKPSGIEWLGDVPEHWKIIRLAYSAVIENGTTPSRENQDYWLDGDIPWLSSGEVNQYRITEANEFITSIALDECSLRLLPKKTIVLGMIGQGKTRGLSASLEIEACINQNLAAIVPGKNLESDYLLYIFQSVYDYLREFGRGGNQAALNCEILSAFKVPIPPLEEQFQIRDYLEARVKEFDTLTAEAQRAIDLLQERRTALISAAVTGQIDVRGIKIKARAVQYY